MASHARRPAPASFWRWVAAVTLLILGPGTAAAQQTVEVRVVDDDFVSPTTGEHFNPTIRVGDTVHWVWQSFDLHSSTSVAHIAESWNSGDHGTGFTFDHTFTNVVNFDYYCDIHGFDNGNGTAGGMHGTVIVQPIPEPSGLALLGIALVAVAVAGRRHRRSGRSTGGRGGP
jgi:plastocyanin